MSKNNHIVWRDEEILRRAGGTPRSVQALLSKYSLPLPTPWAIYQMVSRKNIPDRWRAAIIYALLADRAIAPNDLFRRAEPPSSAANAPAATDE